jgi:hypothetical protein
MSNLKLKRGHDAKVHLFVNDSPALGAEFNGINLFNGKLCAVFLVPIDQVQFGEVDNVIPFGAVR